MANDTTQKLVQEGVSGVLLAILTSNPAAVAPSAGKAAAHLYKVWREAVGRRGSRVATPSEVANQVAAEAKTGSLLSVPVLSNHEWAGHKDADRDPDVVRRAEELAARPNAGSDIDNWLRAEAEVQIARRALEASRAAGVTLADGQVRAERELQIAIRAREIADSVDAGGDLDNWVRAEREVLTRARAEEIADGGLGGTPEEDWSRAEVEVITAQNARALRDESDLVTEDEIWERAECEARIKLRAEQIARENPTHSAKDNWFQAEQDICGG